MYLETSYTLESRFGTSWKVSDKEMNFEMMNAAQKLEWENSISPLVGNPSYTAQEVADLTAVGHD